MSWAGMGSINNADAAETVFVYCEELEETVGVKTGPSMMTGACLNRIYRQWVQLFKFKCFRD